MRVITGSARGRRLVAPPGMDTRPTGDMVKEAMFSIVQFEVEGAQVLDLYAGSGQLGVEALSRGARYCIFVDTSAEAREAIAQNVAATGFAKSSMVLGYDACAYLSGKPGPFDLALLDPPYRMGMLDKALPLLVGKMSPVGVILCETALDETLPEALEGFPRRREYRYGKRKLTVYRREEQR